MADVLYIDTGNIGRSIAAKIITEELSNGKITAESAGVTVVYHNDMSAYMRKALTNLGYHPPKQHQPKKATSQMMRDCGNIICFEQRHVREALKISTGIEGKVQTLPKFATGSDKEITDPNSMRTSLAHYSLIKEFLPLSLRMQIYKRIGKVDERDAVAVLKIYEGTARTIEYYVKEAIVNRLNFGT